MTSIVSLFWQICIFRLGPEKVPAGGVFSSLVVMIFLIVSYSYLMLQSSRLGSGQVAILLLINTAFVAASIYLMLFLFKHPGRFEGTLLAILGTGIIMFLLAITCLIVKMVPGFEVVGELMSFGKVVFQTWYLLIIGFILSRALSIQFALGFILSVTLTILMFAIDLAVFPELSKKVG